MSTGQALGAVAGGVIGAFVGGPAGALKGATWGAALGGVLDPPKGPTVEGPRLSDLTWQQSSYGGNIPRIYGTVALAGNVIWLENNKLKEVVKKKKSGGKGGGGGTTTKTYTYFATFALMLCQGEVAGVRRIWCGDKLIYNAGSDDLETIIASNQAAKGWKLYTGTDDQLPDPRYEADVGVGNAPAFRGYTYIAFYDFALAEYSNTLQAAQFKVELCQYLDNSGSTLLDTFSIDAPTSLYQSTALYTNEWAEMTVFKCINGSPSTVSTAQIFRTRTDGGFLRGLQVSLNANPYVTGWSDVESVAITDSSFMYIVDGNGSNLSIWNKSGIAWSNSRFYSRNGYEYLFQYIGGRAGTSYIYGKNTSIETTNPTLLLTTDSSYAHGRIYDIFPCDDCIYALTYTKQLICFDLGFGVLWTLDMSAQSGIGVGRNGAQPSILRTDISSKIYIRSGDWFWSADLSGTISLGSVAEIPTNYDGLGGDAVVGGVWLNYSSGENQVTRIRLGGISSVKPNLAEIILAECKLSSLITEYDLDLSLLTQQVNGYRVSGGTIRSVIDPLQGAYPFDVVPSGYKIKFVPRGQAPVVTIPWEDLAAANGEDVGDSLPYSREMDSQLPQKVTITALSSTREYGAATQSYERLNTSAVNVEQRDIPLVLSDDEIAQMAEKLLFLRWLERDDFNFSLPPTYMALEPSDVAIVQAKFGTFELRQTEVNYEDDGRLSCKAKANSAPLYTSRAVGAPGPAPSGAIPLRGRSLTVLADAPMIYESLQNEPGFSTASAGYTNGWPGSVLTRSTDNGQTWAELQAYTSPGVIGFARNVIGVNSGALIYEGSGLQVDLISGELESATLDQMLAGSNIALYGADGRWEVIRFRDAILQSDGSYILSGLVRGDKGTEWATGLHQVGDYFVITDDPDNAFIGMAVASIGVSLLYRAVTVGDSIDSAADQALTYRGVNLRPLSPVYPVGSRNSSGDLSATWTRRSRFSSSWWLTGVSAPLGETTESYEIDVMSGTSVKRTISSNSPSIIYTAANQVTDFGSTQSAITLRIYQLSSVVGRGLPLETTL